MPADSRQQQKMIYAKRNQYGTKANAPEDWKWIFDSDWSEVKEDKIRMKRKRYNKFFK
jgi:hypothetical protein